MAYMDAGTGSMMVAFGSFMFALFAFSIFGWIANIVAAIKTSKLGSSEQSRFVLHIVGIFVSPLGTIMGLLWFFKWRKTDNAGHVPPPPPPAGNWAPPAP